MFERFFFNTTDVTDHFCYKLQYLLITRLICFVVRRHKITAIYDPPKSTITDLHAFSYQNFLHPKYSFQYRIFPCAQSNFCL